MSITQHPLVGRADIAPTAAQKVVAAMWTLGEPATTKAIAEAAGVGYSTATPILRTLLADHQAVKTDSTTGPAEWQLTATLPIPAPAPTSLGDDAQEPTATRSVSALSTPFTDATARDANQPANAYPAGTAEAGKASGGDIGAPAVPTPQPGSDDTSAVNTDTGGASAPAAGGTSPEASADTAPEPTARTYRKPVQPRRPKGHLRAAVLAVLTEAPQQAFKVSEVCKAIDAANTDGTSNKAGAGAVANALDKLVTSGDAIRREEAKYATYQATPAGG
jgi:hypothetical protein